MTLSSSFELAKHDKLGLAFASLYLVGQIVSSLGVSGNLAVLVVSSQD